MSKEQTPEKNIELYHQSIEEIMGTPPASMVRVGSGSLLAIIVCLLASSFFFTYSDMVKAPAIIQGGYPLLVLTAPQNCKIIKFNKPADALVQRGDTLLWIETLSSGEIMPITANVSGSLEYNPLSTFLVQQNDTIGLIWEINPPPPTCVIRMHPSQAKQVQVGNKIRLNVDRYPADHYGIIETQVQSINSFNSDKNLQILAQLPDSITTSNQFKFNVRGNLCASAEIITGEKTIFNRLINPFMGLIKPL